MTSDFLKQMRLIQRDIHRLARDHGDYETPPTPVQAHMNVVSQIAQASDHVRHGRQPIYRVGKQYYGEVMQLAEAVMSVLDYCEWQGYDLGAAIELKMETNKMRPRKAV